MRDCGRGQRRVKRQSKTRRKETATGLLVVLCETKGCDKAVTFRDFLAWGRACVTARNRRANRTCKSPGDYQQIARRRLNSTGAGSEQCEFFLMEPEVLFGQIIEASIGADAGTGERVIPMPLAGQSLERLESDQQHDWLE